MLRAARRQGERNTIRCGLKNITLVLREGPDGENKPQCAMNRTPDGSKSSTEDSEEKDEQELQVFPG